MITYQVILTLAGMSVVTYTSVIVIKITRVLSSHCGVYKRFFDLKNGPAIEKVIIQRLFRGLATYLRPETF